MLISQLKLVEAARIKLGLSPAEAAADLKRWGEVDALKDLTPPGFRRLMDHYTACGFRDRRRPIPSQHTLYLVKQIPVGLGWTDAQFATVLRTDGIADLRDIDGQALLYFLVNLERYGFLPSVFFALRREVTPAQIRLLQVARKQLDVPDKLYLPMLQTLGVVNSASDLDRRGFGLCMAWMENRGFDRRRLSISEQNLGKREGFATQKQLILIRTLWAEWSGADDLPALNRWLERYHRVSNLRFVTAPTAAKVIAGLRAMKQRGARPEKASA